MIAGLFALLLLQAAGTPLDEGVLVVRADTLEVARESFRLSHGRLSRGEDGWTLATLQYDVADPRQPARILGELGRGRLTVRLVARATERAREFATGPRAVVLDDSVFAPYVFAAWRAASAASELTAIYPRALRRETVQIQDLGVSSTTLNRDPARLRHITVAGEPSGTVHVWLDDRGRLMKVELPSRPLVAERLAGS